MKKFTAVLALTVCSLWLMCSEVWSQFTESGSALPADLIQISFTDAENVNGHGVFSMAHYPQWPPLPPGLGWFADSQMYYSPSLNSLFVDDRALVAQKMLNQAAMDDIGLPPDDGGDGGSGDGSGSGGGWNGPQWIYGTNDFWIEPICVSNALFVSTLHATGEGTNYMIWSTPSLNSTDTNTWIAEGFLAGWTNQNYSPFAIGPGSRSNVFIRAEAGADCSQALPLEWQLRYFGATGLDPASDPGGSGANLLQNYQSGSNPNHIRFSVSVTNRYLNGEGVPLELSIQNGVPYYLATLVNDTNPSNVLWQPFLSTNLWVPTPTDGVYQVSVGLRGLPEDSPQVWRSVTVFRDMSALTLVLTNLGNLSGSRPFIDPAGYTDRALKALTWTVVDASGNTNSGNGTVVGQGWNGTDRWHVTNRFECLDLALVPGTNWVSLQATDWVGAVAMTNFAYLFDTNGDTIAPSLALVWPLEGTQVSGESLTVQASTDDDTASVALHYTDADNNIQTVNGQVERGGKVWVEGVPLAAGTNQFSLTTTDAAGNVNAVSFSVVQSSMGLSINPLSQEQMKYGYADVGGLVGDPACSIVVNGIQGTNYGDGTWSAEHVPLPPGGLVALQVSAQPASGQAVEALLEQEREAIVFTQRYQYSLDYSMNNVGGGQTNGSQTEHLECMWARGVGGTNVVSSASVDYFSGAVWSNCTVTVWPADHGYWPSLPGERVVNNYYNGELTSSYVTAVEAPDVEWMEESAAEGTWPGNIGVSYAESSGRELRLFTGGKAVRGRMGLFDLSASLTVTSELDPNVPDWSFLYASGGFLRPADPPVQVPSEQVSLMALGKLGSDGHLWARKPKGMEGTITPTTTTLLDTGSGEWGIYGLPVSVGEPKLLINRDGTGSITGSNVLTVVGQKISLSCSLLWPPGSKLLPSTNYQWTIPSYAVSNFYVSPDMSTGRVMEPFPTTNAQIRFYWVDGGEKKVTCAVKVGDIDIPPASTTFRVARPSPTLFLIANGTIGADTNYYNRSLGEYVTTPLLHYGSPESILSAGMVFKYEDGYSAAYGGPYKYFFVQVGVNQSKSCAVLNGTNETRCRWSGRGLDTTYPYGRRYFDNSMSDRTSDSPGTALESGAYEGYKANQFDVWLMFEPAVGSSGGDLTIPVPMAVASWNWSATAVNTNGGWALVNPQYPTNSTGVNTLQYPSWNLNIANTPWTTNSSNCDCP